MAIKKSVEFKGIRVTDAYIRVVGVSILQGNTSMEFSVQYLAFVGVQPFTSTSYQCQYDIDGSNPVQQCYDHIKNLDEFLGSIDC